MDIAHLKDRLNEKISYLVSFGIVFDRTQKISRIITKARTGLNAAKVMARDRMSQRNMALLFHMLFISQVDYGFRMLTLSNTQLSRHKVMRTILGCTRNTPAFVMYCVLGLCAINERHKLAQFKGYLRVRVYGDNQHPLHEIWTSYQNKTRARHRLDSTSSAYH